MAAGQGHALAHRERVDGDPGIAVSQAREQDRGNRENGSYGRAVHSLRSFGRESEREPNEGGTGRLSARAPGSTPPLESPRDREPLTSRAGAPPWAPPATDRRTARARGRRIRGVAVA